MARKAVKAWRSFTPEAFPFSVNDRAYYVSDSGVTAMRVRSLHTEKIETYKGGPVNSRQEVYLVEELGVWTRKVTVNDIGVCVFESEVEARMRYAKNGKKGESASEKAARQGLARIK